MSLACIRLGTKFLLCLSMFVRGCLSDRVLRKLQSVSCLPRLIEEAANQPKKEDVDLFGLFYDKKDVHWQVSRTRRDSAIKRVLRHGALGLAGCSLEPSAELKALRESQGTDVHPLEVCLVQEIAGVPKLLIPDPSTLPFVVPDAVNQRMEELALEHMGPAAKRPRLERDGAVDLPDDVPFETVAESFKKVGEARVTIDGKVLILLRVRRLSAGVLDPDHHAYPYLYNNSSKRVTLSVGSCLCRSGPGRMADQASGKEMAAAGDDEGVITWPWQLARGPQIFFPGARSARTSIS